jgi:L-alanine-DL-glutamate epimerase-like enolase superfamily enzyme
MFLEEIMQLFARAGSALVKRADRLVATAKKVKAFVPVAIDAMRRWDGILVDAGLRNARRIEEQRVTGEYREEPCRENSVLIVQGSTAPGTPQVI